MAGSVANNLSAGLREVSDELHRLKDPVFEIDVGVFALVNQAANLVFQARIELVDARLKKNAAKKTPGNEPAAATQRLSPTETTPQEEPQEPPQIELPPAPEEIVTNPEQEAHDIIYEAMLAQGVNPGNEVTSTTRNLEPTSPRTEAFSPYITDPRASPVSNRPSSTMSDRSSLRSTQFSPMSDRSTPSLDTPEPNDRSNSPNQPDVEIIKVVIKTAKRSSENMVHPDEISPKKPKTIETVDLTQD